MEKVKRIAMKEGELRSWRHMKGIIKAEIDQKHKDLEELKR